MAQRTAAVPAAEHAPSRRSVSSNAVETRELNLFGPRKFVRTTGAKNVYTTTINVPAWLTSPFRLRVQNGEADGSHRVSSAIVEINGVAVDLQSDFNRNVLYIDRTVTLTPTTELRVTLASQPASYLLLSLFGTSSDYVAPSLSWIAPAANATVNTATPRLLLRYEDQLSGLDLDSLKVWIDDTDRTAWFTRRSDEASADVPATSPLSEGLHTFRATIADQAKNAAEITGQFRVDLTAPVIAFTAPAAASYLNTRTPAIALTYSDDVALDLASLHIDVNGTHRTASFTATPTGATGALSLPEGSNTIVARIRDRGGNETSTTRSFHVDVTAPTLAVAQPAAGARLGNPTVAVTLTYGDNLAVDPATATASVDGAAVALTALSTTATGTIQLTDGPRVLTARIADRAGNVSTQTVNFVVDTTVPVVRVVEPAPGAILKNNKPAIRLQYSDEQGITPSSVTITIDGVDRTSLFTIDATAAVATLTEPLADGTRTIAATVADTTGNSGSITSTFVVDTVVPTGAFSQPAALVDTATPLVVVDYADSGSGIDPASVRLFVDGIDRTPLITAGADSARATLDALTDGPHYPRVYFSDRAGNVTTIIKEVTVDTVAPLLEVVAPANDSFTNTTRPPLRVRYSDVAGTGVATGTLQLTLRRGAEAPVDVTSYVTVGAAEAIGQIPETAPLADGTYVFRAEVRDLAGNVSIAEASFELDTVAPSYTIESPAANEHVNTGRPAFGIRYDDELSGADVTRASVRIDGVIRTSLFAFANGVATATLPAGETLADGPHTIEFRLYDRAGNLAANGPQAFIVDTVAPVATITAPAAGAYLAAAPYAFAMTFADGSGVDPASVKITIDGTDRTADFAITATGATASLAGALTDGAHSATVTLLDWAGNPATATSSFKVDHIAPAVTLTAPAAEAWVNTPTVTVTGSVADASPVSLDVNGLTTLPAADGTFTIAVPASEGTFAIKAVATDAAGNKGNAERSIHVDTAKPVITITAPAANFATKQPSITLSGTVADSSAVTLTLNGQPLALTGNAFSTAVDLPVEGTNTFTLVATDPASNSATATVAVIRDTITPQLTVASPAANAVIGTTPVVVRGTVTDATTTTVTVNGTAATVTGEAWQVSLSGLGEGPQTLTVAAADAAGNTSSVLHELTLDLSAPVVTITAPASGTLTRTATVTITGTATDETLKTVSAAGVIATLEPGSTTNEKKFTLTAVPLTEGDNTVRVVAADALAREGTASVLVTRDSTAPSIVIDAPSQITRSRGAKAKATVTDDLAVKTVAFQLDGADLVTLTALPYETAIAVPATANVGDVLTLTVTATDTAGNTATATHTLRVAAEGAVTGQVLSDVTGLPLANTRVRVANAPERMTTTDARGRYALPANESALVLIIDKAGHTSVERTVAIESGVGTVPVDARLTPRAPATSIGPSGATLTAPGVTVTFPAGAASSSMGAYVTPLSPQGLPNLLPLGWSAIAAFDVATNLPLANIPLAASLTGITKTADLVFYKPSLHAWVAVATSLTPSAGRLDVSLPEQGTYALAMRDDANGLAPVPAPVIGEPLQGVAMQPIPDSATSSGEVTPATLPVTGGNATGRLTVHSTTPLPSGTVVQTEVTETFSLATGETASEETRTQDIVLSRAGNDLTADFPIVPSRGFAAGELLEGRVHLDILAGRETIRGKTGGSQPLILDAGAVTVTIAAGSLPQDLAIAATPVILSSFLPATAAAIPHAEVVVDFSGVTLATPAELSIGAAGIGANETVVIARVERVGGVPKVIVAAATDRVGDRFVSRVLPGFFGLQTEGRYVFYRLLVPWGLVSGNAAAPRSPIVAQADGFPFVAIANGAGQFNLIAPIGDVRVTASVPNTPFFAETAVSVTSGATATASLPLAAAQTTATVTPASGAIRVPTSTQIEIAATAPLRASSANVSTIQLRNESGASVSLRFVLSGSGRVLAVIPTNGLEAGQTYTLSVNGLTDDYGNGVPVDPVTFTTTAIVAPSYDTNRIVFTMPGSDGMVTVSAPAGSLPPGTRILIVNSGNGVVVSYTAGNDGSFTGQFPATISDRLLVTITDPQGNVTNFERSRWEATDGSGRVAIGPAGGTVEGTGGTAIVLPDGALTEGAVFKVEHFGPEEYEERPDFPGAHFGSGLKITSEQMPTLKKEGDLVFPKPADAPAGSFYYVYRRLTGPNGQVAFQAIDHAFENADGKIVTASYPFIGWKDSTVAWQAQADMSGLGFGLGATTSFYLMYSWDAMMPGLATQGVIAGKVLRPVWKAGATEPEYEAVPGAMVRVLRENGTAIYPTVAQSGPDGTFSLWDALYTGGTVDIEGALGNDYATATAFEANVANTRTSAFGADLRHYGFAAHANLTFPVETDTNVSGIDTYVMKLDSEGKRQPGGGMVIAGTPLVIGFKFRQDGSELTILSANISGAEYSVTRDVTSDPMSMDYVLADEFTPSSPGSYTITGTALPPVGAPITFSHTFLAIAAGGNNAKPLDGTAPGVVTELVDPKPASTGNPTTVFAQIVFTEPVKKVAANARLVDGDGMIVASTMAAIGVGGDGNEFVIADLEGQNADVAVTSITIRPKSPLKYGMKYTIRLESGIVDLDKRADGTPDPLRLKDAPLEFEFTTLQPEVLGTAPQPFSSNGVVVLDDRAYAVENSSPHGKLRIFDIGTDPASPAQVGETYMSGSPSYIGGEAASPVNGGRIVVVPTSLMHVRGPSNLWMWDVSSDTPERIGAVSLTNSMEAGVGLRVAVKGRYAYTWTYPVGLQVIDLLRMKQNYMTASADGATRQRMLMDLVSEGRGFGQDAIVNTIPVPGPSGGTAHIFGVKVADFVLDGMSQPLIIATGSLPLVVASPQTLQSWRFQTLSNANGESLTWSWHLALGRSGSMPVAVIVGNGTATDGAGSVMAVVDLTNPREPKLLSTIKLPSAAQDVALRGTLALVPVSGSILLIDIANATKPVLSGSIPNIDGRLAVSEAGVVVTVGGATLKTAALGSFAIIRSMTPVSLDENGETEQDIEVTVQLVNPAPDLASAELKVYEPNRSVVTLPLASLKAGEQTLVIPKGTRFRPLSETVAVTLSRPDGTDSVPFITTRRMLQGRPTCSDDAGSATAAGGIAAAMTMAATLDDPEVPSQLLSPNVTFIGTAPRVEVRNTSASSVVIQRVGDESWTEISGTSTAASLTVTLGADWTSEGALLQIRDAATPVDRAVAFLVADPSLPPVDSNPAIRAYAADPERDDEGRQTYLMIAGEGFAQNMKVVIGRGATPGFTLETLYVDATTLQATLPATFLGRAEDLFAAVLATDGKTMSNAVPLTDPVLFGQTAWDGIVQPDIEDVEAEILTDYTAENVEITGVEGVSAGMLQIRSVNIGGGHGVKFHSTELDGTPITTTSTVTNVQPLAPTFASGFTAAARISGQADDPPVQRKKADIQIELPPDRLARAQVTGANRNGAPALTSAAATVPAIPPMEMLLGGRYRFGVYVRDGEYVLLCNCELRPSDTLVRQTSGAITLGNAARPQVQLERESGEADHVRLRAIGLTRSLDPVATHTPHTLSWTSADGKSATRVLNVIWRTFGEEVTPPVMQAGRPIEIDRIIATYADKYHVPPHYLKGQMRHESGFRLNYRHEPITIDTRELTGDRNTTRQGSERRINISPRSLYRIGGPVLANNQAAISPKPILTATVANQKEFTLDFTPRRHVMMPMPMNNGRHSPDEQNGAVSIEVENAAGVFESWPTQVHCDAIFRRSHATSLDPGVAPQDKQFCVLYDQRKLIIGGPGLTVGKRIRITARDLATSADDSYGDGTKLTGSLTVPGIGALPHTEILKRRDLVRGILYERKELIFRPGDTIAQHFQRNLGKTNGLPNPEFINDMTTAAFMDGGPAISQTRTEFRVDSTGAPIARRDPSFDNQRAQFWAAATLGPMQVSLVHWTGSGAKARTFQSIFSVVDRNFIELLWNFEKGAELGAALDDHLFRQLDQCRSGQWTDASWREFWGRTMARYNAGLPEEGGVCGEETAGVGYRGEVFRNVSRYYRPPN